LLLFLRTLSDILTAGIAITAFSLFLYALAFNLRDRVARSFALILIFTVIIYTSEAMASVETQVTALNFWLRLQWVGIVYLPAAYLHFSDALLAITGRPSRGRRSWAVRLTYIGSTVFLLALPFSFVVGPVVVESGPAPHLQPTIFTDLFLVGYLGILVISWANFIRAFRRTTTSASRRRMVYLITSAVAPVLGAFPFLPYLSGFAARHEYIFWTLAVLTNLVVGTLIVVMAYAVAFFGVSWPDRVVKTRLFKWIMRGPFTASVTLAIVTLTRRAGVALGFSDLALVPIFMVAAILLLEYLITVFAPLGERLLFSGRDTAELAMLRTLENELITRNDLKQFLEMVLGTACDRMQASGGYIAALDDQRLELVVTSGKTSYDEERSADDLQREILQRPLDGAPEAGVAPEADAPDAGSQVRVFRWGDEYLFPLMNGTAEHPDLLGLMSLSGLVEDTLDEEHLQAMETLVGRATLALQSRRIQQKIFQSLESVSSSAETIQRMRAAGQYDSERLLDSGQPEAGQDFPEQGDLATWVKDALSHYWGGPKLTQNPLLRLRIVQDALERHDGNPSNALRAILREGIDRTKPEGERRFTGEWILYNILEMKFVEGRKVREVASRLAMSEADLYRKQRIAVEEVAKVIAEMEREQISKNIVE
jgi:hypothetical protein